MKRSLHALLLAVLFTGFHQSILAQCDAVTGGTGNGNTISSLPSCGGTTANVNVPHSGFAQLTGLEVGGVYTVNISGGSGANRIAVRSGTPTGGSVTNSCTSCTSLSFTASSTSHYVVVNQDGCPGVWNSSTSALLNYTRNNPPTASVSVSYDCSNTVLSSSGGAGSYQWQGFDGTSWVNISGATSSSYTITGSTNPQYNQYRLRTAYGSCFAFSSTLNVVPRANFTGNVVVTSNVTLGGTYTFSGNFTVNTGVTVTAVSGCILDINAQDIIINGTINANTAGSSGGSGGSGGAFGQASSGSCTGGGGGGAGGAAGGGSGGGGAGGNGGNGSVACQSCGGFLCIGNADGCVGGGGGGGGARGGSYGGQGGVGGYAAVGNSLSNTPCTFCFIGSTCSATGGSAGGGGTGGSTYGTDTGTDISMGSGGGGAGGGGGGWATGQSGGSGGAGGGGVRLNASRDIVIPGLITANGGNGGNGGLGSGNSADNVRDCSADPHSCCSICSGFCVWDAAGGNGGGAGGGSGGGIYIAAARNTSVTGTLRANGGNGGNAPTNSFGCLDNSRGGGAGGGGRIKIFRNPCGTINISPAEVTYNGGTGGSGPVAGANGAIGTYNIVNHPSYSPLAAGSISSAQTICTGGTPSAFTGTASTGGISGSYTYNWFSCTGGSCPTPVSGNPSPGSGWTDRGTNATGFTESSALTSTTTYVRRTTSGVCVEWSNIITVTVVADPAAGTPSFTNGTICAGGSTSATSTVTGGTGTPSYQWQYFNGSSWNNVVNGTPAGASYTGATTTTLNISGITAVGTHQYRMNVSFTGIGCDPGSSPSATLTVVADPTAATPTFTNGTICAGGTTVASSSTSGGTGSITYQWQYFDGSTWNNVVNGTPAGATYSGATTTSMTVSGITAVGTHQYRMLANFTGSGCDQAISSGASFTVVADPTAATPTFTNGTICAGGTTVASSSTSGGTGSITYQWQYFDGSTWNNVVNGTPAGATYSGATTTSMTVSGITAVGTHQYRMLANFTGSGCDQAISSGASFTVVADPTAATPTFTNGTICAGGTTVASSSTSGGTGSITYQWQYFDGSTWNNVVNGTPAGATYSGATTTSMTVSGITAVGTHQYRMLANFTGSGCDQAISSGASFTVVADPTAATPTFTNGTICAGGTTVASSSTSGGTGSITYQWQYFDGSTWNNVVNGTPAGATYSGATTTSMTVSGITAVGTHEYRMLANFTGSGCDQAISSGASFTVVADVSITTHPSSTSICESSSASMSVTASGGVSPYTYVWQYFDGTNWVNATAGTPSGATYTGLGTNSISIDGLSAGVSSTVYPFRVLVQSSASGCDDAVSSTANVTVYKPKTITSSSADMCEGGTRTLTATPSGGSFSGTGVSGTTFTAPTPSGASQIYTITYSVAGSACPDATQNITVYRNTVAGTIAGGHDSLCLGSATGTMTLSGHTGSVTKWQRRVDSGSWVDITHTAATYSETPATVGVYEYRAVVKNGPCNELNTNILTKVVVAQPTAFFDELDGQCSGLTTLAGVNPLPGTVSGGTGSASFLWEVEIPAGSGSWTTIGASQNYTITAPITNSNPAMDSVRVYRFTFTSGGVGCNTASISRNLTVYAPPTLIPTMDHCVSTLDDGSHNKWNYIFLNASSIHTVAQVNDLTAGSNVFKVFNLPSNIFTIYRIPMNITVQTFEVVDGKGCSVASTGFPTSTGLPQDLPRLTGSGSDTSVCYMRSFDDWTHFRPGGLQDEVMVSLRDNGIDLGQVTVVSFKDSFAVPITTTGGSCAGFTQHAMRRHFKITSSNFPDGALISNDTLISVRLYFSDEDFQNLSDSSLANGTGQCAGNDDITVMNDLYVTKYTDTLTNTEDGDYMNNNPSGIYRVYYNGGPNGLTVVDSDSFNTIFGTTAKPYNYVQLEVSEFSEFWLHGGSSGSPLPVEMLFIEAKNINNSFIRILWATATEINNHKFEVERSEDGLTFIKIGEVMGNGTSTERHDYSFDDKTALPNIRYYYRLKQIDFDDKFEYSPIVSEMLKGEELFTVSEYIPNPASEQGKLFIKTGREQEISIEMHNYVGQVVKEGKTFLNKGSNTINVDFSDLAAGAYTTRIVAGNTVVVRRVIVNR